MESVTSSPSASAPRQASHHDELFLQQSLLFLNSLKDLKNLRKQLYSAADYFEVCYGKEDQKQMVIETLKDYAIKAFINTVDHLGTVAYKLDTFLDEKSGEVSETQLRFSCIEQRLQACEEFIDSRGRIQQSLALKFPKHHKRYIFPDAVNNSKSIHPNSGFSAEENLHRFKNADQAINRETPSFLLRKGCTKGHAPQSSSRTGNFNFIKSNKVPEKRAVSPFRFSLLRSRSPLKRSTSPNPFNATQRCPSEPRRPVSLFNHAERGKTKDIEQYSSKTKRLFKALVSMRKSQDGGLYKYLDEN